MRFSRMMRIMPCLASPSPSPPQSSCISPRGKALRESTKTRLGPHRLIKIGAKIKHMAARRCFLDSHLIKLLFLCQPNVPSPRIRGIIEIVDFVLLRRYKTSVPPPSTSLLFYISIKTYLLLSSLLIASFSHHEAVTRFYLCLYGGRFRFGCAIS